jgi:hypothetical protein
MTIPTLLLGFVISTLYGALFHLWRGGGAARFLLYLLLSWLGFWAGHFLGVHFKWSFFDVGPLHLGMATLFSLVFLAIGYWLSLVERTPSKSKK